MGVEAHRQVAARLHHVGLVVREMAAAMAVYRRLGFHLPAPSCGAIAGHEGGPATPFGAINVHAEFARDFVELVACVDGPADAPPDAVLVPVEVPREHVGRFRELVARSVGTLAWCLQRFQGLHILALQAADLEAVAARLGDAGVAHGGVHAAQRRIEGDPDPVAVPIRFLELESAEAGPGRMPEGRVAIVSDPSSERPDRARQSRHPNGAVALVEAMLCVADTALPAAARQWATILGLPARAAGATVVFELEDARLVVAPASALAELLPGERPPALPAFVAYAVAVGDVAAARELVARSGFPVRTTAAGEPFVPAEAALGAAVIFRATGDGA
ncbi:VOC family protein [Nannocystis punicea]|uniref:VOC family protein n=1 Tax=Nannocystis punicea TaxID=2995304 RepID=A0ABY7HCY1_9BACT|nr:VOC family protein [Nannocystis poenicansa]WAS96962.1 VOC family protein [Nannocystis poenicansa]